MAEPFWLQPESRRIEFKVSWPGGDKIARTVVAFANGAGGRIVFGVQSEPREIIGIPDEKLFSLEEQIANHIFDKCTPTIIPEIYIQNVEGKPLLVVEVFPGSQKPYYLKKLGKREGTYIRIGSVNRKASEDAIVALERSKRKISFDELPAYDTSWNELNLSTFIEDFSATTKKKLNDTGFENIGLLCKERDEKYPTNAALLLSEGINKNRFFPYAKIECARFKGTDTKVFLDQATIDGPIHASVEPCIAFIKRNIALGSKIGEVYREDRWEYPLEAIREALTNAIIHRDYSIQGSDIKVAIFDDMLEITSPGPLPDNLPPDALGTGRSEIRNRVLAPIFKELGLIEAWGTGIRKMREEMKNYPDIRLELGETGNAFQVQFVKLEVTTEVQEAQGAQETQDRKTPEVTQEVTQEVTPVVRLLGVISGDMSRKEIQNLLNLKDEEHFRTSYLLPAIEAGLIEMTIPDKPTSSKQRYRITEKGMKRIKQWQK
mgnify:CR=1 FL=1